MPIRTRRIMWASLPWVVLFNLPLIVLVGVVLLIPWTWLSRSGPFLVAPSLAFVVCLCAFALPGITQLVNFHQRMTLDADGIRRPGLAGWSLRWADVDRVRILPFAGDRLLVVEPRAGIRVSRRLGVRGPNRVQRADLLSVAMSPADGERVVAELRRRGIAVEL